MVRRHSFALFLVLSLLANAFCLPSDAVYRRKRDVSDNKVTSDDTSSTDDKKSTTTTEISIGDDPTALTSDDDPADDDDDDDDDDFKSTPSSSGGGSNILSLINLASAFFPSLSGNNVKKNNDFVKQMIRDVITKYQAQKNMRAIQKRQDIGDNVIDIDYTTELKPPIFERQESDEGQDSEASESNSEDSEENNGGEESVEQGSSENGESEPKQDSASNASTGNGNGDSAASDEDNDSDYDEPEGDGQGGGVLGLLAGISGDGESDLSSLLGAIAAILTNLSGGGVDVNAVIATGLGLIVGLLSDEESNPGQAIASYFQTSLDTITGGGAQNNGAFFGNFLSTLVKGISAADGGSSEEGDMMNPMADSAGFFASLLMGLLGDMSKHSSGSSSWR